MSRPTDPTSRSTHFAVGPQTQFVIGYMLNQVADRDDTLRVGHPHPDRQPHPRLPLVPRLALLPGQTPVASCMRSAQ